MALKKTNPKPKQESEAREPLILTNKDVRRLPPTPESQALMEQAKADIKIAEVAVKKEPQKRDQVSVVLIRGSAAYRQAVVEMADYFDLPISALYATALRSYARSQNYELPNRATTKEVE